MSFDGTAEAAPLQHMPIQQITIVGTGLIGGSLGLALKQSGFAGTIIGCDKRAVLEIAQSRGAIDRAEADLERAIVGSDVLVLATPVGCILSQLEALAALVPPTTLITDAGSTKQQLVERARDLFGGNAAERFLPGHPMAGKEVGGIEHADANLFRDAVWLITPMDARSAVNLSTAGISGAAASHRGARDDHGRRAARPVVRLDQPPAADDRHGASIGAARRTRRRRSRHADRRTCPA